MFSPFGEKLGLLLIFVLSIWTQGVIVIDLG